MAEEVIAPEKPITAEQVGSTIIEKPAAPAPKLSPAEKAAKFLGNQKEAKEKPVVPPIEDKKKPVKEEGKVIIEDKKPVEEKKPEAKPVEKATKEKPVKEIKDTGKTLFNEDELAAELTKELEPKETTTTEEGKENVSQETKPAFDYKKIKEQTGIEAKDEKELVEKINELKKTPKVNTDKIKELRTGADNISKALSLDDKTLAINQLIYEGKSPERAKIIIEKLIDKEGEEAVTDRAADIRDELKGFHSQINADLDKELSTPQYEAPANNTKEIFSTLDKAETIGGLSKDVFASEIAEIQGGNYNSIIDTLPKEQLAEAIVIAKGLEKYKTALKTEGFKAGFKKAYNDQILKKVLNHDPSQEGKNGRALPPKETGKKPDASRFAQAMGIPVKR